MELTAQPIVDKICKALSEKQATDIKIVSVAKLTDIADYFIIASGKSVPHIKATFDNLEEKLEAEGIFCRRKEGYAEGKWIAADYGIIIVHIFNQSTREFYQLDKLWNSGNNITTYTD